MPLEPPDPRFHGAPKNAAAKTGRAGSSVVNLRFKRAIASNGPKAHLRRQAASRNQPSSRYVSGGRISDLGRFRGLSQRSSAISAAPGDTATRFPSRWAEDLQIQSNLRSAVMTVALRHRPGCQLCRNSGHCAVRVNPTSASPTARGSRAKYFCFVDRLSLYAMQSAEIYSQGRAAFTSVAVTRSV